MRWLWPEAGVSCAVPGGPCPARVGAAGWSPAGLGAVGCPALGQPGHPGAKVLWRGAGAGAASAVLPLLLVLKHLVPFGHCQTIRSLHHQFGLRLHWRRVGQGSA